MSSSNMMQSQLASFDKFTVLVLPQRTHPLTLALMVALSSIRSRSSAKPVPLVSSKISRRQVFPTDSMQPLTAKTSVASLQSLSSKVLVPVGVVPVGVVLVGVVLVGLVLDGTASAWAVPATLWEVMLLLAGTASPVLRPQCTNRVRTAATAVMAQPVAAGTKAVTPVILVLSRPKSSHKAAQQSVVKTKPTE
jgi:hypothetical protein